MERWACTRPTSISLRSFTRIMVQRADVLIVVITTADQVLQLGRTLRLWSRGQEITN